MKIIIFACLLIIASSSFLPVKDNVGLTKTFTLKPGQSGSGTSPLPMQVSGTCQVTQLTGTAVVCGYSTSGTVTINGQTLSNDQSSMTCFSVTQGTTLDVTVSGGAGAYGIYQTGTSTLIATCNINLLQEETTAFNDVGITKTWTLLPGKSGSGTSPLPIPVSGTCTVESLTGQAVVCGYATAGTITINGNDISDSQSSMTCFTVEQGTVLNATVSAGAGAYGIYKTGNGAMTVTCQANLLQEEATAFNDVGITKTWTIDVGKQGSGTSPLPIPVQGSCTVESLTGQAVLCAYATAGTISINGNAISDTQSSMTCLTVEQGTILNATVGAGAGAHVIYKTGNSAMTLTCQVNLLQEEATAFNDVGVTKTWTIDVGKSGSGTSPLPIPVSGSCTVEQLTGQAIVCGYVTAGTLTVNGQSVSTSSSSMTCLTVEQGTTLSATASAGAGGYGIYKSGQSPMTVTCSANLLEEQATAFNDVGITKTWTIDVGKSKSGTSPLPIPVSGSCTVEQLTGQAIVCGYVTAGTLTVNGQSVSTSSSSMTCLTVEQGTTLSATASAGAGGYGIYKSGQSPMTVTCTVNLLEEQATAFNDVGVTKTWTLQPGKSGSGTSPLPIPVSGTCTVESLTGQAVVCAYATAGSITINGNAISDSQSAMTCFTVEQGTILNATVSAGAGAYGIYKTGNGPMTVTCSANLMQEFEVQDITETFTIQPGQSKSGTSPLPMSVTGSCTCTSLTGTATLCIYVSSGSATINGNDVSDSSSDPTCLNVQQGSTLNVTASASVSATGVYKEGNGPLTATCNINLMDYLLATQ